MVSPLVDGVIAGSEMVAELDEALPPMPFEALKKDADGDGAGRQRACLAGVRRH